MVESPRGAEPFAFEGGEVGVLRGLEDHGAPPAHARETVNSASSNEMRLVGLEHSRRVATLDNDEGLIAERVGSFFTEVLRGA